MVTLSPLSESAVWHLGRGAWWEAPGSAVSIASGQESCLSPGLGMGVEKALGGVWERGVQAGCKAASGSSTAPGAGRWGQRGPRHTQGMPGNLTYFKSEAEPASSAALTPGWMTQGPAPRSPRCA